MNHYTFQQNACVVCEESRGFSKMFDRKGAVDCPKPRIVGVLANNPIQPLRLLISHQVDSYDSRVGAELLDIILGSRPLQEGCGEGNFGSKIDLSPPPFGSPPARVSNPLIKDSLFGEGGGKLTPLSTLPLPSPSGLSSPAPSVRRGGWVRANYGLKAAAVRVEGFDCLNRDGQNSGIPTVA